MWSVECGVGQLESLLAVPFEEGDGGGVGNVEGAGWTWDGDVDHNIALGEDYFTDAVALVADDEGCVGWKLGLVDICSIRCGFDCDDFFICRDEFSQVGFLCEIPFYVVAA